jgi:hypothetical protein
MQSILRPGPAQRFCQLLEVWGHHIRAAWCYQAAWQWLEVIVDQHEHCCRVYTTTGWYASCLGFLVKYRRDPHHCIKRVLTRDDTSLRGDFGGHALRPVGKQAVHHAVEPALGAEVRLGHGRNPMCFHQRHSR